MYSWLLATMVFVGVTVLLGGPASGDAGESIYSTWAVEHGDFGCAYPHIDPEAAGRYLSSGYSYYVPLPTVAPVWPLVSGGVAALTKIGHSAPFPSVHALGAGCASAYAAVYTWAHGNRLLTPTLRLGYLSWFALLAGFVAVLRASGRGRRRWEALGVVLIAFVPVVWEPVLDEFHPQDLLAMGLILGGIACAERLRWSLAGVLLGLAVATQQFALLVLAPLFIVAPGFRRWRLAVSAAGAWILVGLPFLATGGRHAWSGMVFGTGDWGTDIGGAVLWETGLKGHAMVFTSRVLPVIVSLAIAWWVRSRIGDRVFEPANLLSLLATTLSLRLVFEQDLFGYKFMALGVMLVVLSIVRGRRVGETLVWLAAVTLVWNPVPYGVAPNARTWGHSAAVALSVVAIAVALVVVFWGAAQLRVRWYVVVGLVLALLAFAHWHPWKVADLWGAPVPRTWLWQVVLLTTGIALAMGPLVMTIRRRSTALHA